eukprot:m.110279 g.110279  ORF g.110279 m.110279 type:complete len:1744 (+) comp10710_c0_seq3:124-5355(+)
MRLHMALVGLVAVGALATVNAQALGDHICAREGQTCNCRNGFVRYGSGTTYTAPYAAPANGSVLCSNSVFGDPLPNVRKECRCNGTGIYGVTVNVFPSSAADWATRPACGSTYNDQCCQCTLSGARLCANSTGCDGNTNGGTGAGYTCQSCPCKNPGIGCMLPRCTSLQYQVETAPNECTQIGNLNFYAKGACSSSYNASLQANATCPVPAAYVGNHQYPGTSTSTYTNYCNYFASPACAPRFCTSTFSRYCSQQCAAMGTTGPNAAFNVTQSLSPAIPTPAPSHGGVRPPPPPPGPPAPSSACVTTAGGLCFTDGLSYYGNNEHCTIQVLRQTKLQVVEFNTETNYDVLTVNGRRYSGRTGPVNVTVGPNTNITWTSDRSVTNGGFLICALVSDDPPPASAGSGEVQFFTSSTCSAQSAVSARGLPVTIRESTCAYAPFQDAGLYPITTQCGVPQPVLPAGACHGSPTCSNNGVCNTTSNQCQCYQGYGGADCSQNQCPNNCAGYNYTHGAPTLGTCQPADATHTRPWCECNAGYSGTSCGSQAVTIGQYVNRSYTYRQLSTLFAASPQASALLNQVGANYTLFAPSNTAIQNIPTNIAQYLLSPQGASALTQLLEYHIVPNLGPAMVPSNGQHTSVSPNNWPLTLASSPATVFELTSRSNGSGCAVTRFQSQSGIHQCITDGTGAYHNNVSCSWTVHARTQLSTPNGFQTESGYDILSINGRNYSGSNGPSNAYVYPNVNITWHSDYSITSQGFVVCAATTPMSTVITTNSHQSIAVDACPSTYSYCNRPLANGYIRTIESVMIPSQVLTLLPTATPTSAAPSPAPTSYPTGTCSVTCDTTSTYCGGNNTCVCLPGYVRNNSTSCTYVATTVTTTTALNQNSLFAAIQNASDIGCGDVVMGNTTGGTNVLGNAGADDFYRLVISTSTPQPIQLTTCDSITSFDTYLRVYTQAPSSNGQFQVRQVAYNDDAGSGCNSGSRGLASNLTLTLSPGVYYVLVEGFSSASGAYALHVQCIGSATRYAPLACISTRQQNANGHPYGPAYYTYQYCCLPNATNCYRSTCPGNYACNQYNGCLPSSCQCGTSSQPSSSVSNCNTDYCMNTSKYGICGAPFTSPPTPAPTVTPCQSNSANCDLTSTYCGMVNNAATCVCRTGFVPPSGSGSYTSCNPMPTTTMTTTTTTTFGTAAALSQEYRRASIIQCGNNYTGTSSNASIIGRSGGDVFFRLYVSSRALQPVTLTTCNPATSFDTVITIYQQTQDAVTQQYRFTRVAYNDDAYPRCTLGTGLASSVTQTLQPGFYLVNVEGYSSTSQGNFTLAVECGPSFGPTPPPTPAPPAPLACTRSSPSGQWTYALCTLYNQGSSSYPCPSGSTCTHVVPTTECIPVTCGCSSDGSVDSGSCDAQCQSNLTWGVCLPANSPTPAPPPTPYPTYAGATRCTAAQLNSSQCDPRSTYCMYGPLPGGSVSTTYCPCLTNFNRPAGTSQYSCVPSTMPPTSITTPSTSNVPQVITNSAVWANAVEVVCGSTPTIAETAQSTSQTFMMRITGNTPQPLSYSVCSTPAAQINGINIYELRQTPTFNAGNDYLQLYETTTVYTSGGNCIVNGQSGINVTVTVDLPMGNQFFLIFGPQYYIPNAGFTLGVGCDQAHVHNGVAPSNGGKGFNSLSKGDQHAVVVAIVSVIVVVGVVGTAFYFVRRYTRQNAYTAAMLAREATDEDDQMLELPEDDAHPPAMYEDNFDSSEQYGD